MEVKTKIQREYNPAHPNYERWQKARDLSFERAQFVENIISRVINPAGLSVLDLGAGEGHTSQLLSKNNFVISLEVKHERIVKINRSESLQPLLADGFRIPIKNNSCDIIILQDVIEHLQITDGFISELYSILKKNGVVYLSTPNKYSVINIISDPHWGMPFLSLFKRNQIKKYFLKHFRKDDFKRTDIAELFSLGEIQRKFSKKFSILLFTNYSVEYLLNGGKGIVWSNFHMMMVRLVKSLGLKKLLLKIANDKTGIVNKFLTPTFYIILKKI